MNIILKYAASSGNVYNLKASGIKTKTANYHNWTWGVNSTELQYGARVSNFKRNPLTYQTKLIFEGTVERRRQLIDQLHEDFENDVRNKTPGRILWGSYYIDCFITASSTYPDKYDVWTDNDITIYCPYPFWIKDVFFHFGTEEEEDQQFLDYTYGFDYDFYLDIGSREWRTGTPFSSEFLLIYYGVTPLPRITINNHIYEVDYPLYENERIEVDSRKHTITHYNASNQPTNIFDFRMKEYSVFERIPGGDLTINWSGDFAFDLTLFEERSEPRQSDDRYEDLADQDDSIITALVGD